MTVTELEVGTLPGPLSGARARESRWTRIACRGLDIVVSAVTLLLLLPVFAVIAIVIRLDSPGGVVYRQRRLGLDLKPFDIAKFRTMRQDAGHEKHREYVVSLIAGKETEAEIGDSSTMFKLTRDDRITWVGHFLRRSSLDELPQLWNVLRGEMSLVGPRPPIPYEVEQYPPDWFRRFAVRPGMTGLWQVSGRSRLGFQEMIVLDLEYVERQTFWLNVGILARTIPAVVRGGQAA